MAKRRHNYITSLPWYHTEVDGQVNALSVLLPMEGSHYPLDRKTDVDQSRSRLFGEVRNTLP